MPIFLMLFLIPLGAAAVVEYILCRFPKKRFWRCLPPAALAIAVSAVTLFRYHGWDDGYDFSVTISPPSSYGSSAQAAHDYFKEDKNVLYDIRYDGEQKYTNAEGTGLDGPNLKLPEGYNFLLWFDGSKVRVVKDGRELDIYGDGYYREGKDWYVPGYKNFTVDEDAARASVVIAAAKSPMLYVLSLIHIWGSACF